MQPPPIHPAGQRHPRPAPPKRLLGLLGLLAPLLVSLSSASLAQTSTTTAPAQSTQSAAQAQVDLQLNLPRQRVRKDYGNFQLEEQRVGGRLERLTVRHANGLVETYENDRTGALWLSEADELGQPSNLRQWTIGRW